ncbi:pentapeptide repeat-containing protein [Tateyamaria sp. syn59]|uniref:pentapeptide repeat-containing protein n=1 Tax=Tateyamaria sp. syn59 TaxID=2576942 RepID=UPI0011BEB421|nr:pentapeptide repeat-containing protein [Tateyamaria sp. syn59]
MENTITILITLPATFFWGLITLAGVIAASGLVYISLPKANDTTGPVGLQSRFGAEGLHPIVFLTCIVLWTGLTLVLVVGLFGLILDVATDHVPQRTAPTDSPATQSQKIAAIWEFRFKLVQLTALTTVLGAAIALPVTLIRLRLASRQTEATEDGLLVEKLNTATKALGETISDPNGTRPNTAVRIAAIMSLERIASEAHSMSIKVQILQLLAYYIQEHATGSSKRTTQSTKKPSVSGDIRAALKSAACVCAMFPSTGFFGSDLFVDLRRVNFSRERLLDGTFRNARLNLAQFGQSSLHGCRFEKCHIRAADCRSTLFHGSVFVGCLLRKLVFDRHTTFTKSQFLGCAFREIDFSQVGIKQGHLNATFADGSVTLPHYLKRPPHWSSDVLREGEFDDAWRMWQSSLPVGWDTSAD